MGKSKELVAMIAGKKVVLDKEGTLAHFRVGDIITRDPVIIGNTAWQGEKVEVVGFTHQPDRLWGAIRGDDEAYWTDNWNGLLLLERPIYKFKVSDNVSSRGKALRGKKGKIIAISPIYATIMCYYVAFEGWRQRQGGFDDDAFEFINWIPTEYKKPKRNCCWCVEGDLNSC